MERKFTLVFSLLFLCLTSFAAAPTVPSSNMEYTTVEGDKLTLRFRKGDGQFRIVVLKEGAAINSLPVNGTDYVASPAFGLPASAFATGDGYVVYKGGSAATLISVSITNLKPATTYFISVFEYNGSGTATEYQMVALTTSKATVSAPTAQGSFKQPTNIIGNSVTLNWELGNGARRLIVARKANAVNAEPIDLQQYAGSNVFGDGGVVAGDNYAVYSGSSNTTITVSNLEPNTTYHFALFEHNGSSAPVYLKPAATMSVTTNAGPTKASGAISYPTVDGNRLGINFSRGNGKHQLIIGKKGSSVTAQPVNGQRYEASTIFGQGEEIADDEFVLNSLNSDRTFTNLDPSSVYHFRVYDFDIDANGNTYYLTSLYSQGSGSTAVPPTQQASALIPETLTGSSFSFKYTAGDSRYRLIVMKAGSPVDAVPADLTKYDAGSANFGQGQQITPGNYVIYGSTNSNAATVSMLTPGTTYHIAIWGWNGLDYPIYKQDPLRYEVTVPNEPSSPATSFSISQQEGNAFHISWSGGDGARRIVIARKGAAVTAKPQDGQPYEADNDFGEGTPVEDGQFVVHDGVAQAFTLRKLDANSVYHFAIFEYNVTNNLPDYRVSTYLSAQGSTLSTPASQAVINSVDQVQSNSARINLTKGSGNARLVVMRAVNPVSVEPQDFTTYSWTGAFGNSNSHMGDGNYVVASPSSLNAVTVTALSPNTEYHIAVFEFNGTSGPLYLRPGNTYHFTTAIGGDITPPTVNSSNPVFTVDGNKLSFNWQKGDGARRIVVMKEGTGISFQPADGTDYPATAAFGNGNDLGGGQYVVYSGTQQEATITNLQPSTSYSLVVYEYNGAGATSRYLIAGALSVQRSTSVMPSEGSTGANTEVNARSVTLNWQKGSGDGRIVVLKEGSTISGQPADLSKYPADDAFKQGAQIATGEYVVYAGTGSSVTVTGLDPLKTYHFSVFEYNGLDAPVYNKVSPLQGQVTTTGALPLKWRYFSVNEKPRHVELKWGTTNEVGTALFVIERSSGGQFEAIDSITSKNTAGDHDYSYNDMNVPAGSVKYRIKQVDIDGAFTYSRVIQLDLSVNQAGIALYPNPAKESLRIMLPAGLNRGSVTIYDAGGKLVMSRVVNNGEVMAIEKLGQGIYTVMVVNGEKRYVERLMKM